MRKLLALAALVAVTPALADTCMVSPTEKQTEPLAKGALRGGFFAAGGKGGGGGRPFLA